MLSGFVGGIAFAIACHAAGTATFPVRASANGRYLVDAAGNLFAIKGRTAWFLTSLAPADYRTFLDDTVGRGHNAIELHVINHDARGNHPPWSGNGSLPFVRRLDGAAWDGSLNYADISHEAPDLTAPNEDYWSFVDGLLTAAESRGLLVFLFPLYVGYDGGEQGWMQEMLANGPDRMQRYGHWIATRYQDRKNLVWMLGGDLGTAPKAFTAQQTAVEAAMLRGMTSVPEQQSSMFSAEWNSESIATDQPDFGDAITLNGVYSWSGDVARHGRRAYARSPVMPAFLLEEPYDEEGPDGNSVNPSAVQPVRRFQWSGWLSTIGGYISGNGYVWPFREEWWHGHLDTPATRDMARLNAFIDSIAWHKLVPSGLSDMRTLIIEGGSSPELADYVAAAAAADGSLLIAYIPPAHAGVIAVDMSALRGPTRARWFDPTNAAYTLIAENLPKSGSRRFSVPGLNSAGASDWVLVIDIVD